MVIVGPRNRRATVHLPQTNPPAEERKEDLSIPRPSLEDMFRDLDWERYSAGQNRQYPLRDAEQKSGNSWGPQPPRSEKE